MYYRLPGDVTAGVYDRVASLWFVGMVVIFMSGNSALTIAYTQKPLLRRELYAGHYSYLPYYVAKTLTTLPLQLAYCALYVLMTYFLVIRSSLTHTLQVICTVTTADCHSAAAAAENAASLEFTSRRRSRVQWCVCYDDMLVVIPEEASSETLVELSYCKGPA